MIYGKNQSHFKFAIKLSILNRDIVILVNKIKINHKQLITGQFHKHIISMDT